MLAKIIILKKRNIIYFQKHLINFKIYYSVIDLMNTFVMRNSEIMMEN